jgi:hypothetical protein
MSLLTVFGGTGFLGRRVRHLRERRHCAYRLMASWPYRGRRCRADRRRCPCRAFGRSCRCRRRRRGQHSQLVRRARNRDIPFGTCGGGGPGRQRGRARPVSSGWCTYPESAPGATSTSAYICSRGEGKAAVQAALPGAVIIPTARHTREHSTSLVPGCRTSRTSIGRSR